jgi:endo-alpha-1,4-polygalactosaminidase (GH114 family)
MKICGEPDKPEVKKHIEDLDNAWDNITALFAKREENLINAMEKAMEFHETLQVTYWSRNWEDIFRSRVQAYVLLGYSGFLGASGEQVCQIGSFGKRH